MVSATAVTGAALGAGLVAAGPAAAAATEVVGYSCEGGLVPVVGVPITFAGPAGATEDAAVHIAVSADFAPLRALAAEGSVVRQVELVFGLQDPVGDIDLAFGEAPIKARDWDARGGQQVSVLLRPEYAVPTATAQMPTITEAFTFDPGSSGQTVAWQSFRSIVVTYDEAGADRVVTCRADNPDLSLWSTSITTPVAPHPEVVPVGNATVVATPLGTVGLPDDYDPDAPAPTVPGTPAGTPGQPADTPGGSGRSPVVGGGLPNLQPGQVAEAGTPGAESAAVAVDAQSPAVTSSGWTWFVVGLGVVAAVAALVIILWGQRGDRLEADASGRPEPS